MPPRKKKNNEELEKVKQEKISSFVNTANERDNESSDEEYNIYVKSARANEPTEIPSEPPADEISERGTLRDSKPNAKAVKQVKKIAPREAKAVEQTKPKKITRELPSDPNEKLYKMFDEYKNELNDLRNIVTSRETKAVEQTRASLAGGKPQTTPIPTPAPLGDIDIRREMMKLKFS